MAQRTVCLCNGKLIGIETIYSVVNGQQINIPEKLKELRTKSRNNELFCPCGCGANLVLVAGDRNLREQHFRLKTGESDSKCHIVMEGRHSVVSKIVLKCWFDDKLHDNNIESRVAIHDVDDTNRKYEFTLLSKEYKIAISYCHGRANLSDEKLQILESNSKDIRILYVADYMDSGTNGQYPEWLMKIQDRQGYCLYLLVNDNVDYYGARMKASFYMQDIEGMWEELLLAEDLLNAFDIDYQGNVLYQGNKLSDLYITTRDNYLSFIENERIQHEEEAERKRREYQKKLEEWEKEEQRREEKREKYRVENAERERIKEARSQEEIRKKDEIIRQELEPNFTQQERPIRDKEGNRWIQCEFCGLIARESKFSSYGGKGRVNLGTCYNCLRNNSAERKS